MKNLSNLLNDINNAKNYRKVLSDLIASYKNGIITEFQYNWLCIDLTKKCIAENIEII